MRKLLYLAGFVLHLVIASCQSEVKMNPYENVETLPLNAIGVFEIENELLNPVAAVSSDSVMIICDTSSDRFFLCL